VPLAQRRRARLLQPDRSLAIDLVRRFAAVRARRRDRGRWSRGRRAARASVHSGDGSAMIEHVLVTGASGGIGRAIVQRLSGPTRKVAVIGRDVSKLLDLAAAVHLAVDLADED